MKRILIVLTCFVLLFSVSIVSASAKGDSKANTILNSGQVLIDWNQISTVDGISLSTKAISADTKKKVIARIIEQTDSKHVKIHVFTKKDKYDGFFKKLTKGANKLSLQASYCTTGFPDYRCGYFWEHINRNENQAGKVFSNALDEPAAYYVGDEYNDIFSSVMPVCNQATEYTTDINFGGLYESYYMPKNIECNSVIRPWYNLSSEFNDKISSVGTFYY
ncbi:hypothetical protein SAMN05444392_11725 [Seinonella peptonophila]|uniref:Uncharacterized protein n=1 Tax=Seinonella peptonophila TaxID=112248 RepID=A0A1M5B121_9BACL|nr:hypothetical protein [Seinonella peptonophila]SHF36204.1 hypothetical protein SAMN05444392_11725 [Seinonella peptonophila]